MQEAAINHPGLRERAEKLGEKKQTKNFGVGTRTLLLGGEHAELGHRLLKKSC